MQTVIAVRRYEVEEVRIAPALEIPSHLRPTERQGTQPGGFPERDYGERQPRRDGLQWKILIEVRKRDAQGLSNGRVLMKFSKLWVRLPHFPEQAVIAHLKTHRHTADIQLKDNLRLFRALLL